jgi:hypothetical protein
VLSEPALEEARLKKQAATKAKVARTPSQESSVKNRNQAQTTQRANYWKKAQLEDGFADVLTAHIKAVSAKVSAGLITDSTGLKEACTCPWKALVKMAIEHRIQFTAVPGAKLPNTSGTAAYGWPTKPAGALAAWKFQLGT